MESEAFLAIHQKPKTSDTTSHYGYLGLGGMMAESIGLAKWGCY